MCRTPSEGEVPAPPRSNTHPFFMRSFQSPSGTLAASMAARGFFEAVRIGPHASSSRVANDNPGWGEPAPQTPFNRLETLRRRSGVCDDRRSLGPRSDRAFAMVGVRGRVGAKSMLTSKGLGSHRMFRRAFPLGHSQCHYQTCKWPRRCPRAQASVLGRHGAGGRQ
jgi:hypothetical protein